MVAGHERIATAVREERRFAGIGRLLPVPLFRGMVRRGHQGALVPVGGPLPDFARKRRLSLAGGFGFFLSFLILVGLPVAAAGVYYGLIASPIYMSETKFAVRGTVEKLAGDSPALQVFSQLTAMNSNQDAYILADYIESLPLIQVIEQDHDLRKIYGRPDADFWARLPDEVPAERLRRYWAKMVRATVDNLSGVVTLQVKAFTPEDALAISNTILEASEKLVNEMSIRRNRDAVRYSQAEVDRAEARVQAARLAMQKFRTESGTLDPVKEAEATLKLAMLLKTERIQLENEVAAARRTLSENAPSLLVLNARLVALKEQIRGIEQSLTGGKMMGGRTTATALYQYEGLELERLFSEKVYLLAQTAYQKSRETADKQSIYLVTFVKPALAELPLFPRRAEQVVTILACAAAIWAVVTLLAASIRDHNI